MSRTYKDARGKGSGDAAHRRLVARGVKRRPLDYRKLSRALLDLAQAQAEAEATAQAASPLANARPPKREGSS